MARGTYWLSTAVVFLIAGEVAAQAVPDFSGRWTSAADPAAGPGRGGVGARGGRGGAEIGNPGNGPSNGWSNAFTLTQDTKQLVAQTTHYTARDMQAPLKFTYMLDGSESKNAFMVGRGTQEQTSKAVWDGAKLVITTVHTFPNPHSGEAMTSETKQVLTLENPTTLVIETTQGAVLGGKPTTTKTTYRKS